MPDHIPTKKVDTKAESEIFSNAKELLDNGTSLERLSVFLKTKLLPSYKNFATDQLIIQLAKFVLDKLGIDHLQSLSDRDKFRVLKELNLLPADQINKGDLNNL